MPIGDAFSSRVSGCKGYSRRSVNTKRKETVLKTGEFQRTR